MMTENQWRRLQELFEAAAALPPSRREAFLAEACGGDPALHSQVRSLIVADETGGDPVAEAVNAAAGFFAGSPLLAEGARLGPYRVLRELGKGGMGAVYLAVRDDDQFSKNVAVKLIRLGMDSPEALARFKVERQILANLEHPNIARLLDGGANEHGLPYVVMEYVDGRPLTEYCDRQRLGVRQRLELFRKVCAAVQYAHQHLVVHRDLKPGNLLVGADGEPKLLDFGIAKLLSEDSPAALTRTDVRLMTREYASPEQVRGLAVSTASDIYSLGVVLYELLVGRRPYAARGAQSFELERAICEEDPERPSTAVTREPSTTGDSPAFLQRALAGDLDNIVLKAMRKEPAGRYASAEQFSEDVRRYLQGYPVMARRGTWSYRAAKFVRRNRLAVAAVAVLAIVILGFAVSMAALAGRLARERDRAERVSSFLVSVFQVADPSESRGVTITAREILDRGAARINEDRNIEPAVRATLKLTIARVYQSIGLHSQALPLLREARETRQRLFGERSGEVAESLHHLAWSVEMGGHDAEAERLYRTALALRRTMLGPAHEATVDTMMSLAGLLRVRGRYPESEALYRDGMTLRRKHSGPDALLTAETLHDLAQTLHDQAKYAEAEPLFREALAIRRARWGNDHPEVADNLNNLALLLYHQGRYMEAEPVYRESLGLWRKVLGPEHHNVGTSLSNLALLLASQGRGGEAAELYRESVALRRRVLGPDHQLLANTMKNLADLLTDEGDPAEAERLYREALAIFLRRVGEEHLYTASALRGQALLHLATGRLEEAEKEVRRAIELRTKLFGARDHRVADGMGVLARVLAARGDSGAAEELFRDALRIYREKQQPGFPGLAAPLLGLGDLLVKRGAAQEAEPLSREALDIRKKTRPARHWSVIDAENSVARSLLRLGRKEEARALLLPLPGAVGAGLAPRNALRQRMELIEQSRTP